MENKQDMPREKLNKKGAAALTGVELLQALIVTLWKTEPWTAGS